MTVDLSPAELEHRLVRRILAHPQHIDAALEGIAQRHILDFAGVALAGLSSRTVQLSTATLAGSAGIGGLPGHVIGTPTATSLETAILLNAMAAHIHDFDDDEPLLSIAHTTVPVMAAAWTLGRATGASGKTVIAAYICGVETMMRLGQVVNAGHYRHGWHATATLGVFGAAVASAVVLGCDEEELLSALGFAASMSAGLRSSFGSDGKCLQVGQAARNGYEAVRLARAGLRAAEGMLFGPQGFVQVYGGRVADVEAAAEGFLSPSGLREPGLTVKAYPCCTATHTAVDAVLALVHEQGLDWQRIQRIEVLMGVDLPGILIHDRPARGLEGKFSMRYCAAAAARFGKLGIAEFEDAVLADAGLQTMLDRVEVTVDTVTPRPAVGLADHASVRMLLDDGSWLARRYEQPTGSAQRPFSDEGLLAKFAACAAPLLGATGADAAGARLMQMATAPDFAALASAIVPAAR